MRVLRFVILFSIIVAAGAATALADPPSIPPGHDRYIVVLNPGADEPDIPKFGGTLHGKANGRLYISLPPPALKNLRKHASVKYIQHAILGPSADTSAAGSTGPHVAAESFSAAPSVAPPTWTSGNYVYDGAGNIAQIGTATYPANDNKQNVYTYDKASRLKQATIGLLAGDRTELYDYDAYGNMTTKTVNGSPVGLGTTSTVTNRMNLRTYDEVGSVNGVVGDPATMYLYDPMSRMIEKDWGYGWSQELYVYTPSDERIGVYAPGASTWTWTVRDFDGKPLRQYSSVYDYWWTWVEDYAWEGGRLLAGERQPEEGGRRHFHLDHLGSPRLITGFTGERIGLHDFAPFGEEIGSIQQERQESHDREEPMKFTGHERDYLPVTGENTNYFDYMHARSYSPVVGRFLSADPVIDTKSASRAPQQWNRYAYANDNPLRFVDPTGKYTCKGYDKDECQAFNTGLLILRAAAFELARAGQPGATRLRDIMNFYGKLGVDNGVHVEFGNLPQSAAMSTHLNSGTNITNVTVDRTSFMSKSSNYFQIAVEATHEGDHGLTLRANPELARSQVFQDLLWGERSAYRASAYIYSAFRIDDTTRGLWTNAQGFDPGAIEFAAAESVQLTCMYAPGGCK